MDIQKLVHLTQLANPQKTVLYFAEFEAICEYIHQNLIPRDLVLTIGAGNITDLSRMLVEKPTGGKPDTKAKIVYAPVQSSDKRQVV